MQRNLGALSINTTTDSCRDHINFPCGLIYLIPTVYRTGGGFVFFLSSGGGKTQQHCVSLAYRDLDQAGSLASGIQTAHAARQNDGANDATADRPPQLHDFSYMPTLCCTTSTSGWKHRMARARTAARHVFLTSLSYDFRRPWEATIDLTFLRFSPILLFFPCRLFSRFTSCFRCLFVLMSFHFFDHVS